MSNQTPLSSSSAPHDKTLAMVVFPPKAAGPEGLNLAVSFSALNASNAPPTPLWTPEAQAMPEVKDLDDDSARLGIAPNSGALTLSADTEVAPPVFWSPLSVQVLQSYTWFGPWGPPGDRFQIPDRTIVGLPGKDFVVGTARPEAIYGQVGSNLLAGGGGDDLLVAGPDGDSLVGGPGNDVLIGGAGNDYLEGGPGNDWLYGGDGSNVLTGWTGQDVFAFLLNGSDELLGTLIPPIDAVADPLAAFPPKMGPFPDREEPAADNGPDTITDFTIGEDLILVAGLLHPAQPVDFNPFDVFVQLTQVGTSTQVSINQVDSFGTVTSTDIAILNNIDASQLNANSFVFA